MDKAYRRGKDESLAQRALDMKALNEQLEVKDTRNTELMVQIQLAEQLVKDAEKRVAMAEEDAKLARQEATEIAATFGAGSGGGKSLNYTAGLCFITGLCFRNMVEV